MPFGIRFGAKAKRPAPNPADATPVVLVSHTNFRNKIALIKAIREATALGLKDAKDLADQFTDGHQPTIHCLSEDHALHLIDDAAQIGVQAKHAE